MGAAAPSALAFMGLDETGLRLRHGLRWSTSRYRIRVAMHELPSAVFRTEDARDAQGNRSDLLAPADFRLEPLDFQDVPEVRGYAFREVLELDGPAVAVVRCGSTSRLLDLTPTAGGRAKGVREGDVFTLAEKLKEGTGIPLRDLIQRAVARFNCSVEVLVRCSHVPTSSPWQGPPEPIAPTPASQRVATRPITNLNVRGRGDRGRFSSRGATPRGRDLRMDEGGKPRPPAIRVSLTP